VADKLSYAGVLYVEDLCRVYWLIAGGQRGVQAQSGRRGANALWTYGCEAKEVRSNPSQSLSESVTSPRKSKVAFSWV